MLFLQAVRLAFDEKAKNFPEIGRLSLSIAVSANEKIVDSGKLLKNSLAALLI